MKNIKSEDYRVVDQIKLAGLSTDPKLKVSERKVENTLSDIRKKLAELQEILYAHRKYAVLVCLQGIDTAGKDSLIREVFKELNVRGVVVHSFKIPTELELRHNYLWRYYITLPERGKFGIFNRTHYENVLVTRVHPEYILNENLPGINSINDIDEHFWEKRFEQINNFEKTITENGTIIFKFFMNISKEEQKERLLRRLNEPNKNWKFSPADLDERDLWDKYMMYFEDALNKTSKPNAPWYIIPSDDKPSARLIVASIILDELKKYDNINEPVLDPIDNDNISAYKDRLKNS